MQKIESAIERAILLRKYGALLNETFDLARSQANHAIKNGFLPFPIVIKDCFALKDYPMTCASKMLDGYIAPYTATVVQRLINKGGCVIGKSNLDEFSMGTSSTIGFYGPVKNGIQSDIEKDWLIPGGSSGGSAVAVQLGMAEMAIGSDTGGSTRNPASLCGLFGFKPTYGVLSRYGLVPLVNSFDVPSIFANSARECWKYLEMVCGIDDNDPTSVALERNDSLKSLQGLRIGIPKEYHNEDLSEESWQVWNRAANVLQSYGAIIVPISLPHTKYSLICYHVMAGGDIASNMARYDGLTYGYCSKRGSSSYELCVNSRNESLNSVVRNRIMAGNYFLMKQNRSNYFERAQRIRRIIANEIVAAFNYVDIILTPVASGPPSLFSRLCADYFTREDHDDFYTQPANLAGIPAMSVPFGECSSGLPIGVQVLGNRLKDQLVCDVSQLLYNAGKNTK